MSHDLSAVHDDVLYDAAVNDLRNFGIRASRPANSEPQKINRKSLARVAFLLSEGVMPSGFTGTVLGSADWTGPDAPDISGMPAELPKSVKLHEDGLGHTEVYPAIKFGFRVCCRSECENEFTVKRGARSNARWPVTCSAECRRLWRNERDRATYAKGM
ncbi:hypothetical protein [Streptomyces sp. WMMB303]|uniref:hypothetical protein n=1 Tax=Streptomyces sp. WMMB303 TaxID=3034154 RepID=UPI0023EE036F|nr:hypothetical protein [Streptomyces sp. WMMB303]MDF4250089.1 hypothetical protein [Streptomyces sp. WMMB303]